MRQTASRILLAATSLVLIAGAVFHTSAFGKVVAAVRVSNLAGFYGSGLKMLWIGQSVTLLILSVIYASAAIRPAIAPRPLLAALALFPASTAILLFLFFGAFFPSCLFLTCAVLASVAAVLSVSMTSAGSPHETTVHQRGPSQTDG